MKFLAKSNSLAVLLMLCTTAIAQPRSPEQLVEFRGVQSIRPLTSGETIELKLDFSVKDEFHIQSNRPANDNVVATELTISSQNNLALGTVTFPVSHDFFMTGVDGPISVFDGDITITVPVTVHEGTPSGPYELVGQLYYQTCSEKSCLLPEALSFSVVLQVF